MSKILLVLIIVLVTVIFSSCSSRDKGLMITEISSGLGGVIEEGFLTYNYQASIKNNSNKEIYVSWFEPVVEEDLRKRINTSELKIEFNETIKPHKIQIIKGAFKINIKDLSKEDIEKLSTQGFVNKFKMIQEQIIK